MFILMFRVYEEILIMLQTLNIFTKIAKPKIQCYRFESVMVIIILQPTLIVYMQKPIYPLYSFTTSPANPARLDSKLGLLCYSIPTSPDPSCMNT